jgi:hypothetical protein
VVVPEWQLGLRSQQALWLQVRRTPIKPSRLSPTRQGFAKKLFSFLSPLEFFEFMKINWICGDFIGLSQQLTSS